MGASFIGAGGLLTLALDARAQKLYRPKGVMIGAQNSALHVQELSAQNPAATVLLLHGASGNLADMTLTLAPALAQRYRVIAIDRPGHGWSDRPNGCRDAWPARQALAIRNALAQLEASPVVVVGHSWSGALAAHMALRHSDIVSALVLVAAATHPWPGGIAWYYRSAAHPLLSPVFTRTLAAPLGAAAIRRAVKAIFAPQEPLADYARRIGASLLLRPSQFRANAEDMAALHPFVSMQAPLYRDIKIPTQIVCGDADRIVPDLHSIEVHKAIRHSNLRILRGIGHMPHHVCVDEVVAAIDRAVEQARAPRQARTAWAISSGAA